MKTVKLHGGLDEETRSQKKTAKAKAKKQTRKRNPAPLKKTGKEKELTADELFMRAWEYTYRNRHRRLA